MQYLKTCSYSFSSPLLLTDVLSSQVKISQLDAPEIQSQEYLNVTAVVSSPSPPHTALIQCWCIPSHPFNTYPTVGKSVFLGTVNNATMVVLPPQSEEGWHKPPFPMFFVLLSGKAHVQAPQTSRQPVDTLAQQYVSENQEVWIEVGSSNQIVLALDTLGQRPFDILSWRTPRQWLLQIPAGR